MILSNVNIGTGPSAGDGDPLRSAFSTINTNFQIVTNNVNALTNSVTTVAGRTGNVVLTTQDIVGINNYATVSYLSSQIANVLVTGGGGNYSNTNVAAFLPSYSGNISSLTTANIAMRGYVDSKTATANIGMVGYVDSNILANIANILQYSNSSVASYLTGYSGNIAVDTVIFSDLSEQTTAYTGTQWRSNLVSNVTIKPSWLSYYPDGQKVVLGTNYGFNANGMFFYGTADNEHGYPIRTNLHFHDTDVVEIIATINYAHTGDDHGIAIWPQGTTPIWKFSTDASRIAWQLNSGIPLLYGQTTANVSPGTPVLSTGNYYTIKFTYDPTNTVTVETFSGNSAIGTPIDTRSISESLPAGDYLIGFDADQDQIGNRSYFTNIIIRTLTNTVINDLEIAGQVSGNLIPSANVTYSLGNITHQWNDLFVSNNTIYMGGIPLSIDAGGNLLINGNTISGGASDYSNVNTQAYLTTNSYATQLYVIEANSALKVYTDGQVTASNTAVIDANIGMLGYVYQANATLRSYVDGQITAANSAVTAANLGVVGYVDNAVSTANIGIIGYIDQANTIQNGEITAANLGMKGYVDSLTYSQIASGTSNVKIAASSGNIEFNVNGSIYGSIATTGGIALGYHQFPVSGNSSVIAIGTNSGLVNQGDYAVALGLRAGWANQGRYAVAIGFDAGKTSQVDNSIAINASGIPLDTGTAGLYINPVRQDDSNVANIVYYNTSTKEMTYGPAAGSSYGNVEVATYLPTYTGNVQAGNVKVTSAYRFASGAVTITNGDSHVELSPDTGTNALAGVKVGGNGYILGPNASRNITLNYGSASGAVGLQANVTVGTGGSGNLWVYGNVIARDVTASNISASGTSGRIGYINGGFVQQTTSNANGVSLNTISGNIQLMGINLGVNSLHTVAFSNNKLEENDMILITHHSGGVTNFAVGAYYFSAGTALIWIRNITGADTATVTPMLKFAIIKAPGA